MNSIRPENFSPDSSGGDYFTKMDREAINRLPRHTFAGPIQVVDTPETMRKAIESMRQETLLGFDTETRPAFAKGVFYQPALLQLADSRCAYLFRLRSVGFHEELKELLQNASIVKSGVAVGGDIRALAKMEGFTPRGFVDLGTVAKRNGIPHHGLRGLAARLLGIRISKSERFTNWERSDIPSRSLAYAATDAWLGREIYLKMLSIGCRDMNPDSESFTLERRAKRAPGRRL